MRGTFSQFEGALEVRTDGAVGAVGAVAAGSLDTRLAARDRHLRSPDFFDVEQHPRITFSATDVETGADGTVDVRGHLRIRGVTRAITLRGEIVGSGRDEEGAERVGLELAGRLDRREFGLTWNAALDGGGLLVGHRVDLVLELSAVRAAWNG